MATNHYFNQGTTTEQLLYEDIVIESLKIFGQDIVYLPRELTNKDVFFNDDSISKFIKYYKIEMYIENIEGFDGEGDLFTKFGVEIRDEASFIVSRRRWNRLVKTENNAIEFYRPREGDLIYLPLSKSIFEIQKVETESPFYQLKNLPVFRLRASLFEYNDENFDTGIDAIDNVEALAAYQTSLTLTTTPMSFIVGETVTQTLSSGVIMRGEVADRNDSDGILYLAHIGSNDGTFGQFTTGTITGSTSSVTATVTSVGERNNIELGNQNSIFDNINFIDFSETNPFGDPS
jgi:hypothetical protein